MGEIFYMISKFVSANPIVMFLIILCFFFLFILFGKHGKLHKRVHDNEYDEM